MAKANVFNMAGQQVGEIELSEAVFGVEPKGAAGISNNPQKASGRNPQKASARNK